jgi:8-oxo-dGTP pyrophosphatase MutT (NUDIX family)
LRGHPGASIVTCMSANTTPAVPRLAATIMILRDMQQGMEVLMVTRHRAVDFLSGALVFPGGKLTQGDDDPRLHARCSGVENLSAEQVALRVGAIREVFEESGILLARERGASTLLGAERVTRLAERYREQRASGQLGMAELVAAEDLVLACEQLVPFARWITPTFLAKRFDTYFYLAAAPAEQIAMHDGTEMVDAQWLRPADALFDQATGKCKIVMATLLNLRKLNRASTVSAAIQAAVVRPIVTVTPELVERAHGLTVRIPEAADYGDTEYML